MTWTPEEFKYLVFRAIQTLTPAATGQSVLDTLEAHFGPGIERDRVTHHLRRWSNYSDSPLKTQETSWRGRQKPQLLANSYKLSPQGVMWIENYQKCRRNDFGKFLGF